MPVPSKRRSTSRMRRARAHLALEKIILQSCVQCGNKIPKHTVCSFCGVYKGKTIIKTNKK